MHMVFIQPAKVSDRSEASEHWQLCRPYSLIYLQAALAKQGKHTSQICDFERLYIDDPGLDLDDIIKNFTGDVYGVTSSTFTRFEALETIKTIRRYHPAAKIIVGGVHFMNCDIDTLAHIPEVDIVVRGEGETVITELLDALEGDGDLSAVRSISYRDCSGNIVSTQGSSLFEDLDSLDVYQYKSPLEYPEFLFGAPEKIPATSIMTSRGCPFHCVFCAKSGMRYRHRSSESVIREILYYKNNFGITAFNFLDLTFTASPKRARELCEAIIEAHLDIVWWCETRADIPLDLLEVMSAAGCRYLVVGVESGSDEILAQIQKGITTGQVAELIDECKRVEIEPSCYFILSHLGETMANAMETVNFIGRLLVKREVSAALQPCMILPGTRLETIAKEKGVISKDFSWASLYFSEDNLSLGQVGNIPLFYDKLSRDDIAMAMEEYKKIIQFHSIVAGQSFVRERILHYIRSLSPQRVCFLLRKYGVAGLVTLLIRDVLQIKEKRNLEATAQKIISDLADKEVRGRKW